MVKQTAWVLATLLALVACMGIGVPLKPALAATSGAIGDFVWEDLDGDGVQDPDEPGIPGVKLTLSVVANGRSFALETTTNGSGRYIFSGINYQLTDYRVSVDVSTLPAGYMWAQTYDWDGLTTPHTASGRLISSSNSTNYDIDFGYRRTAAELGDRVWFDANGNGVQDPEEPGVADVAVTLWDAQGQVIQGPINTDASGYYLFTGLKSGEYRVSFAGPPGYVFTSPDATSEDADSDADPSTGFTGTINLGAGQSDLTWDAGLKLAAKGAIGDFVWHDLFHSQTHQVDGIQDEGEPGIEGVVVELYDANGNLLATTVTDGTGYHLFTGLDAGTYYVKVADSNFTGSGMLANNWYATYANNPSATEATDSDGDRDSHVAVVTLGQGEFNQDVDFGFFQTGICLEKTGPYEVVAGDTIIYRFRVTNCGDLVLHGGAQVYDPLINPWGNHQIWSGVVWPGEVYEFERSYRTCSTQCGELVNTATAVGHPQMPDGTYLNNVTDVAQWTVQVVCNRSYVTFTQGGWGSCPAGNNPGMLLRRNFSLVYGTDGVRIGGGYWLLFTSARAIKDFLPQGGSAGVLTRSQVDPTRRTSAGVFAGQVLALQLNVDFSRAGITPAGLGSLRLTRGPLAGWTVDAVLQLANTVLGGNRSALPPGLSVSRLNDIVTAINENYHGGIVDRGYLAP